MLYGRRIHEKFEYDEDMEKNLLQKYFNQERVKKTYHEFEFMYEEGKIPFAYKRGNLVMYFNPLGESAVMNAKYTGKTVYALGNAEFADGKVTMSPQSFALVEIDG